MAEIKLYQDLGEIPKQNHKLVAALAELNQFLQLGARKDLKAFAVDRVLSMSGTDEEVLIILKVPKVITNIISLLQDNDKAISENAAGILINISANKYGPRELLNINVDYCPPLQTKPQSIVHECFKQIFNRNSHIADRCCMILSNVSRHPDATKQTFELLEGSEYKIEEIMDIFTKISYNNKENNLDYLASWLSNMTQDKRFLTLLLNSINIVSNLLTYTTYHKSLVRRSGAIGVLRNLCFDVEKHEWLLLEVDILPFLLLPLAGPEEFDEEDNETLPIELQYLPEDKQREEDPEIRKMLIEAIMMLCSLSKNREYIRSKGTYLILRELDRWEKDPINSNLIGDLVNILIRTEAEIGVDNYHDVEVPEHIKESS